MQWGNLRWIRCVSRVMRGRRASEKRRPIYGLCEGALEEEPHSMTALDLTTCRCFQYWIYIPYQRKGRIIVLSNLLQLSVLCGWKEHHSTHCSESSRRHRKQQPIRRPSYLYIIYVYLSTPPSISRSNSYRKTRRPNSSQPSLFSEPAALINLTIHYGHLHSATLPRPISDSTSFRDGPQAPVPRPPTQGCPSTSRRDRCRRCAPQL